MTQPELEQVARNLRDTGLHSSWNELMVFADCVVGNMVAAYQTVVKNSFASKMVSSPVCSSEYATLKEKLVKAIAPLTGDEMVARWESEACDGNL